MSNSSKGPLYLVGFTLLVLFFWYGKSTVTFDRSVSIVMFAWICFGVYRLTMYQVKAASSQFVSNPVSDSFNRSKDHQEAGRYTVVRLGGKNAYGLNLRGSNGTVIAPTTLCKTLDENMAAHLRLYEVPKNEVPPEIHKNLENFEIVEPVYYGEGIDGKVRDVNDDIELEEAEAQNRIRELNAYSNSLREMLQQSTQSHEEYSDHIDRMNDNGGGTNIIDKIRDQMGSGD